MCQNILQPNSLTTWRWTDMLFWMTINQNQINFVFTFALFFAASTFRGLFLLRGLGLILSATKTCEVLFVSTGLAGWWVVRKTNELWVKVMSWNLDERHPFIIFASQKHCLAHAPFTWTIAMRTPLLCTCASHCLAHARSFALRISLTDWPLTLTLNYQTYKCWIRSVYFILFSMFLLFFNNFFLNFLASFDWALLLSRASITSSCLLISRDHRKNRDHQRKVKMIT